MQQEFEICAETVDEARVIALARIPTGQYLLSEKISCDGSICKLTKSAETEEYALALAAVPPDAKILTTEVLAKPEIQTVEVEAENEREARKLVVAICGKGKKLLRVKKLKTRPGYWLAEALSLASVRVTFKPKARLLVCVGRERFHDLLEVFDAAPRGEGRKVAVTRFLLDRKLWDPARETICFCECGYPTRMIYSDRSSGPILQVLASQSVPGEEYTTEYSCPKCGRHIQTITQ